MLFVVKIGEAYVPARNLEEVESLEYLKKVIEGAHVGPVECKKIMKALYVLQNARTRKQSYVQRFFLYAAAKAAEVMRNGCSDLV